MKKTANGRAQVLKGILGRDEQNLLMNIKEDLIEHAPEEQSSSGNIRKITFGEDKLISPTTSLTPPSQSIELFHNLIDKELAKAAIFLSINELELKAWIDLQNEVPVKTILTLLRTMQSLHLDPLCEEISFTKYEDGQWQIFITIEGCSKLLNQHSQFSGLTFTQSDTLVDGVPEWIECAIYRRDRIIPTVVREHLVEVRSDNAIWQKMPRRMLRHRALQQCVRLAIA